MAGSWSKRAAVRRAVQHHRMPRDLGRGRPDGARAGDPGRWRLWPHRGAQQAAGLLSGVARADGAAGRAPGGDGADPHPAAERRLRLADAAIVGARSGAQAAGVAPRHLPRTGPWRVEPGPCAARLRDEFIDDPNPRWPLAVPRRHAARFRRGRRARQGAFVARGRQEGMNRVLAHTGVEYPIVQAPMGWIARSQLASAVSNAGGLGIIETSCGELDACKGEIARMRELTTKPFGVNLPLPSCASRGSSTSWPVGRQVRHHLRRPPGQDAADAQGRRPDRLPRRAQPLHGAEGGRCRRRRLVVEGGEGGGFKNPARSRRWSCCRRSASARRAGDRGRRHLRRPRHGGGLCARRRRHPDGHALRQLGREPGARQLQEGDRRGRGDRHRHAEPQVEPVRAGAQRPSGPRR